jgi:hypothetical protein
MAMVAEAMVAAMAVAVAVVDVDMAAVTHLAMADPGPMDSTEKVPEKLRPLIYTWTFCIHLHDSLHENFLYLF